jgi:integrase
MKTSKQYFKLPKAGRRILADFEKNGDRKALFNAINRQIETQNTLKSKQVRLSVFRGLLRKYFNMSNADMRPIETTPEQKQAYFESGVIGFQKQHEDKVSERLIRGIMNTSPICDLMVRSGLRIGELLDNEYRFIQGVPEFKLNKKRRSMFYPVYILGDTKEWNESFIRLRREFKGIDATKAISDKINIMLKKVIPATFYKRSTHICRAIYALYIHKFMGGNMTLPQVIARFLNHESPTTSIYYQHITLDERLTDFLRPAEG